MKRLPKAIYQTANEIDERIAEREAQARLLPDGETRQAILAEVAQLRMYADAKRWIDSPGLKRGA